MDLLQISRPIQTQHTAIPQGCSTGDKYIRPVELANKILKILRSKLPGIFNSYWNNTYRIYSHTPGQAAGYASSGFAAHPVIARFLYGSFEDIVRLVGGSI
jgi:hypothetical protein